MGLDGSAVQLRQLLCQVQTDAVAHLSGRRPGTGLVEAVEDFLQVCLVDAGTIVGDRQFCPCVTGLPDADVDTALVVDILHGIRDKVGDHLVEVLSVYPYLQGLIGLREREADLPGLGLIVEVVADILHELTKVCLGEVQLHLTFLDFADAQYLVDECQHAVGVALHVAQGPCLRRVVGTLQQLVERTLDKGQR